MAHLSTAIQEQCTASTVQCAPIPSWQRLRACVRAGGQPVSTNTCIEQGDGASVGAWPILKGPRAGQCVHDPGQGSSPPRLNRRPVI